MSTGTAAIIAASPVTATGGVLSAPIGATAPTDAITDLDEAFVKRGFVDQAGVTKSVDASDEKIRAWGGHVVKVVRSEHSVSYTLAFLESMAASVLKLIYGDENVIVTPPTADTNGTVEIRDKGEMTARQAFAFDMKDGKARIREFVPDGQLTHTGDITFVHSAVISYQVTIEAFPDADGVKSYSFMDDGEKLAS